MQEFNRKLEIIEKGATVSDNLQKLRQSDALFNQMKRYYYSNYIFLLFLVLCIHNFKRRSHQFYNL